MENHPIPQDVTGFKFKLIGSVTLKQFLYILGGGILAAICFILPISGFIKLPFAIFFGGIGVAVAFIPIEGRPMDVMLKNFLKALPSENQYIFKKRGAEALIFDFFTLHPVHVVTPQEKSRKDNSLDSRRELLYKTLKKSYRPDAKEEKMLTDINAYLHDSSRSASPSIQNLDSAPQTTPSPLQIVTPSVVIAAKDTHADIVPPIPIPTTNTTLSNQPKPDPQIIANVAQKIQNLDTPQSAVSASQVPATTTAIDTLIPQNFQKTIPPKPAEDMPLSAQTDSQPLVHQEIPTNPISQPAPLTMASTTVENVAPDQTANVTTIAPEAGLKAGFPQLPDTPNIVLGIIKDPRGKVVPNILVEIMNEQGVPVRAFKTNALGQFAAATPLPNGEYVVILEDPRHQNEFEQIKIALDGKIFNPLEIVSIDQREKLRRELFGSQPQVAAV
jgi:hypothetical protein